MRKKPREVLEQLLERNRAERLEIAGQLTAKKKADNKELRELVKSQQRRRGEILEARMQQRWALDPAAQEADLRALDDWLTSEKDRDAFGLLKRHAKDEPPEDSAVVG